MRESSRGGEPVARFSPTQSYRPVRPPQTVEDRDACALYAVVQKNAAASHEPIVITERGHPVAVLKSAATAEIAGRPLPKRSLASMPKVKADSTALISEERDAR